MKPKDVKVGMRVGVKYSISASYSGYGGRPFQALIPGTECVVRSINVPKVRIFCHPSEPRHDHHDIFVNVTFEGADRTWDAGVNYCNLVRLS